MSEVEDAIVELFMMADQNYWTLNNTAVEMLCRFYKFIKGQRTNHAKPTALIQDAVEALNLDGNNVTTIVKGRGLDKKPNKCRSFNKLNDLEYQTIRHSIMNIHIEDKALPELKDLVDNYNLSVKKKLSILKVKLNLKNMGYACYRDEFIVEKAKTRQERLQYLKAMKEVRAAGTNIVYIIVKSKHNPALRSTYLIACAACSQGYLNGSFRVIDNLQAFVPPQSRKADQSLLSWLKAQVLVHISDDPVLVVDKAASRLFSKDTPISVTSKKIMSEWLDEHGIAVDINLTKPEIYAIIKEYRSHYLERELGLTVLYVPKHNKFLNPLEEVWSIVEDRALLHVFEDATSFEELELLFNKERWEAGLKQSILYEDSFLEEEAVLETHLDKMLAEISITSLGIRQQHQCDLTTEVGLAENNTVVPRPSQSHSNPALLCETLSSFVESFVDDEDSNEPLSKMRKLPTEEVDVSRVEDVKSSSSDSDIL